MHFFVMRLKKQFGGDLTDGTSYTNTLMLINVAVSAGVSVRSHLKLNIFIMKIIML